MQVSNNISSFNVWTNYTKNVSSLRSSMSKLSSGSRINNAGDDPSGLAMSERLRAQKLNTSAASRNVENMINYYQTADSWAQKIHDMLGRMGELAVMAYDGTKSTVDIANLEKEFTQLQTEITAITTGANAKAKFNGNLIFQNSTRTIQVGPDGGQTFVSTAMDLRTTGGPATWVALMAAGTNVDDTTLVAEVNAEIDVLSGVRADIGAEMKRMNHTLEGLRTYEENIAATESRIRDVDVAKETAEMSKYSILQQVGTAMLAQANQMPQGVLQLIR